MTAFVVFLAFLSVFAIKIEELISYFLVQQLVISSEYLIAGFAEIEMSSSSLNVLVIALEMEVVSMNVLISNDYYF